MSALLEPSGPDTSQHGKNEDHGVRSEYGPAEEVREDFFIPGTGSNTIFCGGCSLWDHKKWSGIKGPLRPDPDYKCARRLRL